MNFYKHHIGDYAAATAHLSILEDGAYSRLLRIYYRDEKPLPADLKAVQRLAGARSKDERAAVETVLEEFFDLQGDGWHNARADAEIAEAQESQGDAEERRAHERERKRRYRERRRELFDQLREVGIVPPFDTPIEQLEAMLSRGTETGQGRGRPESGTANQTPDSRHQTKASQAHTSTGEPSRAPPTDAGRACLLMRQAGCTQTNPSHPDLIAAIAEGVTPETLADTVREGLERTPPISRPFTWAIATARGRLESGAANLPAGDRHATARRPSAVERVRANVEAAERRDAANAEANHPHGGPYLVAADG